MPARAACFHLSAGRRASLSGLYGGDPRFSSPGARLDPHGPLFYLERFTSNASPLCLENPMLDALDHPHASGAPFGPLSNRAENRMTTTKRLARPLVVVVPVYNAPAMVEGLIRSLTSAVPEPIQGLTFLFSDDASPDPRIREVFEAPFFSRPDVAIRRNTGNLGFIGNVNASIEASARDADVLLLNSDTEIWEEVFSVLQAEAHSDPAIASITPLTNHCTIASVFDFPNGGAVPDELSAPQLAKVARQLNLPLIRHPAPTGVGFCMYLKREAIESVGLLDHAYGRGYGEECDWSRKAITLGWKHYISPKAFVLHVGTQSFLSEEKQAAIDANGALLLSRYPEYDLEVARYIRTDPLKFTRIDVLLAAVRAHLDDAERSLYVLTLHADPEAPGAGGTERHVGQRRDALCAQGHAVLELFPDVSGDFILQAHLRSGRLFRERVHQAVLVDLIQHLAPLVDVLHVHHTLHWPEEAVRALVETVCRRKLLTVHDYHLLSPSIELLDAAPSHSFSTADPNASVASSEDPENVRTDMSIEVFRAQQLGFLRRFDKVLVPSASLYRQLEKTFGAAWEELPSRATILPHDLTYVLKHRPSSPSRRTRPRKRIAFIGGLGPHKGSHEIIEAIPRLRAIGFSVEILGSISPHDAAALRGVPIRPYRDAEELAANLRRSGPQIIAIPSRVPETFCYAFYEGVLLSEAAVPVVGPTGHPADVLRSAPFGIVMPEATADALVTACLEASHRWHELWPVQQRWIHELQEQAVSYEDAYRALAVSEDRAGRRAEPSYAGMRTDQLFRLEAAARRSDTAAAPPMGRPGQHEHDSLPVRYQLVDALNTAVKQRVPGLHTLSKRWARRRLDS